MSDPSSDTSVSFAVSAESAISRSIQLSEPAVVLVPTRWLGEPEVTAFPEGTTAFYRFLKDAVEDEVSIGYHDGGSGELELAQHDALHVLPDILLTGVVLPVVANALWDWVSRNWARRGNDRVRSRLTIGNPSGERTTWEYEGPAKSFDRALKKLVEQQHEPEA